MPAEPVLAGKFGVSRTVLREALKVLGLSGYIEVRRGYGGGTFVSAPAAEEFKTVASPSRSIPAVTSRQLSEVRLAMEPRTEVREVGVLRDTIREMEVFDDRPARVLEANFNFHVAVAKVSDNLVFVALLENLKVALYRDLNHSVRDPDWRETCRGEHEQVVGEIEGGYPERAEEAMRRHLETELDVSQWGTGGVN